VWLLVIRLRRLAVLLMFSVRGRLSVSNLFSFLPVLGRAWHGPPGSNFSRTPVLATRQCVGPKLTGHTRQAIVNSNRGDAVPDFPSQSLESLLAKWSGGDQRSLQALVPLPDHQLNGLADQTKDRRQFVAVADALNSQILVDCAWPHRATVKRGWSMAQTWLSRRRKRGDGGKAGMGKN
jgi:hypothetical protein